MSVKLFSAVWQESQQSGERFLLLLAIADFADDDGYCWSTIETIARRSRCTVRSAQRLLAALETDGELSSIASKPGWPAGWRLERYAGTPAPKLEKKPEVAAAKDWEQPAKKNCTPTTPLSKKVALIFNRRETTRWDSKEIKAYTSLGPLDMQDLELLHAYYTSERKRTDQHGNFIGVHRRDLLTFLNNYAGELDRARQWAAQHPKAASRLAAPSAILEMEPEGFRDWLAATYPRADQQQPWSKVRQDVRDEFNRSRAAA